MPALKLKAINEKKVLTISKELIDELQELIQCPRDYFSIEVPQSKYIMDGKFVGGLPTVEVYWFDRGYEMQDKAVKIITKHIQALGYMNVDVIFHILDKRNYYENGEHL